MTRVHFHVEFMKGWCVYSSSVKQCLWSVNHEQFPMPMEQNSKQNLCWGRFSTETPLEREHRLEIYRQWRRRQQQGTVEQREHCLAQGRKHCQHSDHKHVQRQRQNTTITLQTKLMKRGNTNSRCFKKQWGETRLEVYSQNYLLRCSDRQQQFVWPLAMSCLDAEISLVPKHQLIVPSTLLVLATHIRTDKATKVTKSQSHKATKIHMLTLLT